MSDGVVVALVGALVTLIKLAWDAKSEQKKDSKLLEGIVNRLETMEAGMKETNTNVKANNQANRAIVRYRLKHEMAEAIKRGVESYEQFEEMIQLHDAYHAVGGNGAIDELFDEYKQLPKN